MELECDICFIRLDVNNHRPKSLPCGHTICKECVENPALGKKCPSCRKDLVADPTQLPDNISLIQIIEKGNEPPRKLSKGEDPKVQQLQRGVKAGQKLVQVLHQIIPKAVEALHRQLDLSVTKLAQLEEALNKHWWETGENDPPGLTREQVQLVAQFEDSCQLLTTKKCSFVAEKAGTSWRASVRLGPIDYIMRLLLLQLRAADKLEKVEKNSLSLTAGYVDPPRLSVLTIVPKLDLNQDHLKVNDILRCGRRWRNVRCIRNLQGIGSEKLLHVVAPHLEELQFESCALEAVVMREVEKMSCLKKLFVTGDLSHSADFPGLPLQLEELAIIYPSERQLLCVQHMPRLRSLFVESYLGPPLTVSLPADQHGALVWLGLFLGPKHKPLMLGLIRAYAASLQELQVLCNVDGDSGPDFPDLGQDLAASGLRVLRRLVLQRSLDTCTRVDACLLQLQALRRLLPSSVNVMCKSCHCHFL